MRNLLVAVLMLNAISGFLTASTPDDNEAASPKPVATSTGNSTCDSQLAVYKAQIASLTTKLESLKTDA